MSSHYYQLITETRNHPLMGEYQTYGICCDQISIPDISAKPQFVEHLIHLFTELDLSPIHLKDVVLDQIP